MIFGLFRKDPRRDMVLAFYRRVADASRAPWLYLEAGVPDTVEGRLESLTLHALVTIRRLKALPAPAPDAAQDFVDTLFEHVDHGLRELGVGDTSVPKRMKKIAQNVYGRMQAYSGPLDALRADELASALDRNIPGCRSAMLADYLFAAESELSSLSLDDLMERERLFPASPAVAGPASMPAPTP
jgi:cytochrome b pre-mRNA-processing protein 3